LIFPFAFYFAQQSFSLVSSPIDPLHKVRHSRPCRHHTLFIRNSMENLKISLQILVKFQDTSNVTASVAIVWCRPHSDQEFREQVFVTFLNELMSTADKFEI